MHALVFTLVFLVGVYTANSEEAPTSSKGSSSGVARAENQAIIKEGHSLFNQTCAHCHGPDASTGLPERNLRHLRARYGDDMHSVFETTVMNGRPDKGMPVWGGVLDAKTIDSIYSYLETVQEDGE
ncbi:c-type cytochrome [Bradyrhizobium sp. ARR65]|uniref:cytochrome c n=1 Tax=Bradyrhizobium sp. ARR65 TaxID=1040989 RepID=UPI001FD8978E|nr:c-type cytochrome [Bradyrhizobium sp. ARR65]